MAVGFESKSDYGSYQINDSNPNYVLTYRATFTPNIVPNYAPDGVRAVEIWIGPETLLCFSSTAPTSMFRETSNKVTFWQRQSTGIAPVEVFGFGRQPELASPGGGVGLQVWNAFGQLQFDSNKSPFQMVHVVDGKGSFGVAPGRYLAVFPMHQSVRVTDHLEGAGISAYRVISKTYGSAAIVNGTVTLGEQELYAWIKSWSQNGGPNFPSTAVVDARNRYGIVDVTFS